MTRPVWVIAAIVLAGLIAVGGALTVSNQQQPTSAPTSNPTATPTPEPADTNGDEVTETVLPDTATPPEPHSIDTPLDLVPAEYLLCWKGRPFPGAEHKPDEQSSLKTALDLVGRIFSGQMDETQKLSIRLLETLGIVGRYPFTVTVIDATAKTTRQDGSGAKLDQLRIAAVIQTENLAGADPFLRIIQKSVNEMTDAGTAQLSTQTAGKWQYQTLSDQRLPEWCEIAWGQIEKHFVITFGKGVWPEIAAVAAGEKPAAVQINWIRQVRRLQSDDPLIEVLVSSQKIRGRLDPFVRGRATQFFKAWHIEDVEYMHWAIGFKGQALYCVANYREGKLTKRNLYANPNVRNEEYLRTIPENTRYAIFRISAKRFLPKLINSFYAIQDADDREQAMAAWTKIQTDLKIDAERDALNHLGNTIIAHNYPQQPFNLPLAFTSLIEIKDEPARVRETLEKLLDAWRKNIEEHAEETGRPPIFQLYHDDDGVWHASFFLIHGVAWTFTDQYIVTSWGADALRDYLEKMGDKVGKRE